MTTGTAHVGMKAVHARTPREDRDIRQKRLMPPLVRKVLGASLRAIWKRERYVVYVIPSDLLLPYPAIHLTFAGVNELVESEDRARPRLSSRYESFVEDGDSGLLAFKDGALVGWAWTRRTPYEEPLGCGRVRYSSGLEVIRYFEVVGEARGRGIGNGILHEFTRRLTARRRRRTIALVGITNRASRACFERLGYRLTCSVAVYRILGYRPRVRVGAGVLGS